MKRWNVLDLILVVALAGAAFIVVPGCDDDDDTDADADVDADVDADADADADADGDADADADGDADADADGDADADAADADADDNADADADGDGGRRVGRVVVAETDAAGTVTNFVLPLFLTEPPAGGTDCTRTTETFGEGDACEIVTFNTPTCDPACEGTQICQFNEDCTSQSCVERPDPLHAGTIDITGASGQPAVNCTPDATTGAYTCSNVATSDFFSPDDTLNFSAPGATFPAFDIDVDAPDPINVTSPAWTAADFAGTADVGVAWDGTSAGVVVITVIGAPMTMTCMTADDGSFDLPAEGIAAMGDPATWIVTIARGAMVTENEGEDGEITAGVASGITRVVM